MKLHSDRPSATGHISGYGPGHFTVDGVRHDGAVLVSPSGGARPWSARTFDALGPDDFRALADERPELVLFGSGATQRFVAPSVVRPLIEAGIGVESMDSAAACRTYAILAAEGRHVVAALLPA